MIDFCVCNGKQYASLFLSIVLFALGYKALVSSCHPVARTLSDSSFISFGSYSALPSSCLHLVASLGFLHCVHRAPLPINGVIKVKEPFVVAQQTDGGTRPTDLLSQIGLSHIAFRQQVEGL